MKNNRIISLFLSLIIVLCLGIVAFAEEPVEEPETITDVADKKGNEYVYDYANLLTDEEKAQLAQIAKEKGDLYDISITFLTYSDAEDKSTMTYTDDFYDEYIGAPNGVLFAIDMDNREVYINTVGSCIDNLSDSEIDEVLDDTFSYATDAEYMKFFVYSLDKTLYKITDTKGYTGPKYDDSGYGGDYSDLSAKPNPFIPTVTSFVAMAVVMALVAAVLLIVHNKNNRPASAQQYLNSTFEVKNKSERFMGTREEVIRDYYKSDDSSSGGGGSSHMSSSGVSHGGGGHSF